MANKCKLITCQFFSTVFMPWTVPILKKLGVHLSFFDKGLQQYFIDMIEQIVASRKAGDKVSIVMCSDEYHKTHYLFQAKAWCCQATSHCLGQCWPQIYVAMRTLRRGADTDMNICVLYVAWNYIICYPWEPATFRLLFKLIWILSTFVFHRRDPHFLHYWLFARENPWSSRWIHHKESIMRSRDGFFSFFLAGTSWWINRRLDSQVHISSLLWLMLVVCRADRTWCSW